MFPGSPKPRSTRLTLRPVISCVNFPAARPPAPEFGDDKIQPPNLHATRAQNPMTERMAPSDRIIPFVKANACGNDFLIVDGMFVPADLAEFSKRICDRHTGVGADGVEWLLPAQDADIRARLFNADGSEAEISGNGTRCVAAYLWSKQPKETFTIRTG